MLSRAVGGVAGGKPVFCLPGSRAAVVLGMEELILPELGHLVHEIRK
jgi:molybdenum cofactor biosynthesis protein B